MFKIIGELINTTREKVKEATANRDAAFIQDLAKKQIEAGADWVDVNGGACFYSHHLGLLPMGVPKRAPDVYDVVRIP